MAAGAQIQSWDRPSRRRVPRYALQTPLDVMVLRSGVPDTFPGRSVNLGEGGVAAVVAGELLPGEAVAIELWLPLAGDALRTRALVKHHDKLWSGMEFVALSADQRAALRDWAEAAQAEAPLQTGAAVSPEGGKGSESGGSGNTPLPPQRARGRAWVFLVLLAAIVAGAWWWHWNRGWKELESRLEGEKVTPIQPQAHVAGDIMEKMVIHRVDPDYPAAARPENLQGVIVLDVVVGQDGSVLDMHPRNGPDVLAQAAMEALRWWRFEPYRVDGQPVIVETTVAVEFKP